VPEIPLLLWPFVVDVGTVGDCTVAHVYQDFNIIMEDKNHYKIEDEQGDEKPSSSPPPTSAATARLSQLEEDVAAKQSARSSTTARPGVTAVPSMQRSSGLSQLEQDVAAKTRPGVAASGPLSQLERDIARKTQASLAKSSPSMETADAAAPKHLTQLEQDIAAKVQARSGGVTSRPGVVPSLGLSQFEQDIAAKSQGFAAPTAPSALHQLEQDLHAKQQAASLRAAPPLSAPTLRNLEDDILAKQNAYSSPPSRARAPDPPPVAMVPPPSAASYASSSIAASTATANYYGSARPSTDQYRSSSNNAYDPYNSHRSTDQPMMGYNDAPAPVLRSSQVSSSEFRSTPSYAPGVSPEDLHLPEDHPEAPLSYPPIGASLDADLPVSGIEAFVADHVVDATSVAVIMTDEEEEVEVKKRQRKLMIRMALGVAVLLVAVIVPVALLSGGDAAAITPAPTLSPTSSPTLSPTVADVPQLVNALDLAGISQLSDLQDRRSPQGLAVDWLVNDDIYSKDKGLFSFAVDDNILFLQRYVLAVFYFAMSGDAWGVCHRADTSCSASGEVNSWLTNTDVCTWFVVTCNDQGLITAIAFRTLYRTWHSLGDIFMSAHTISCGFVFLQRIRRKMIISAERLHL
jgi:hypothetical protein